MNQHAILQKQRVESQARVIRACTRTEPLRQHIRRSLGEGTECDTRRQICRESGRRHETVVDHHAKQRGDIGHTAAKRRCHIHGDVDTIDVHPQIGREHLLDRGFFKTLVAFHGQTACFVQKGYGAVAQRAQYLGRVAVERRALMPEQFGILVKSRHIRDCWLRRLPHP